MAKQTQCTQELTDWMRDIRRHLHRYPELSTQEFKTAQFISQKLDELDIPHRCNIANTGILATIGPENTDIRAVALRADMDALPIHEKTGLEFSSQHPGVMHACGHDGHVAMLLGAAALLKSKTLRGQVILIFQPAEEKHGGAERMIEDGALNGVGTIFAGHIDRHFAVGEIAVQTGLICAYTDEFKITILSHGGHAAKPHETVDCIVVASLLVMCIQTLVSREVNPAFPSVVTVGQIQGGNAANVIADQAVLTGTIRTTHPECRDKIITGLKRMVLSMRELYTATTDIIITPGYPPVINEEQSTLLARKAAAETVGEAGVKTQLHPSLGGEDFSFYLNQVPGCLARFGARRSDLINVAAHSPRFDFDEEVLPIGAEYLARCALLTLTNS
ncbi:MAG: amidohydrolase [Desulfobulbaceae bacterium]|uniref:Amidohydrolase n=1 Tax=Candidatus Desulfatifera sulfidica TaxID=2841691 RepID=A0A8J6N9F8_9BACT|nr:amidohydrolase [Candidatus Desulfatifera sulfidica]